MSSKYKVWIQVEHINEERDIFENIGEPLELAEFDNEDGAQKEAKAVQLAYTLAADGRWYE